MATSARPGIELATAYVSILPDTSRIAAGVRRALGESVKNYELPVPESKNSGKKAGDQFAGEFDRTMRKRIARSLAALPDIELDADSTDAERKVKYLRDQLRDMSDKRIGVDVSAENAERRLAAIRADLESIDETDATADVKVNSAAAAAEIAAVGTALNRIDGRNARVDLDASGVDEARSILDRSTLTFGQLAIAAGTLGTAIIPVTAAAGGLVAALSAPLAAAGGGATIFGLLTGAAVARTNEQLKEIDKAREKLGGLTKGTEEYAAAQADLKSKLEGLSPAQKRFRNGLQDVKTSFDRLLASNGGDLLDPLSEGMGLLARVMHRAKPIISGVSNVLSGVIGDIDRFTRGPGMDSFVDFFADNAPPALRSFSRMLGNIAVGVGGLVKAFTPLGGDVLSGVERLTQKFRDFGAAADTNPDVADFIAYVRRVGPQVADTFGALARALGKVVLAGAPIGEKVLAAIEGVANAIAAIPTPVLTGFVTALIAYKVAALAAAGASRGLGGALKVNLGLAAGAAGLALLTSGLGDLGDGASRTEQALAGFKNVAGGALMGFAVGGPWGAAIGGGAGLLATLYQKVRGAEPVFRTLDERLEDSGGAYARFKKSAEGAGVEVSTLTGLLKKNTGALTKNARQAIMKGFVDEGGLALVKDAGVSLAVVQKALNGNADALKQLKRYPPGKILTEGQALAYQKLMDTLGVSNRQLRTAQENVRTQGEMNRAVKAYNTITKTVPKRLVTKVQLADDDKVMGIVKRIQRQYDLTPKEVRTLLAAADRTKPEAEKAERRLALVSRARKAFIDAQMRNYGKTRGQALELWEVAPKGRQSLIEYTSSGYEKAMRQAANITAAISDAVFHLDFSGVTGLGKKGPRGHAAGGLITGPGTGTSDSILTRLSNGEFVIPAKVVKRLGVGFFEAIRKGNLPAFASGGLVGSRLAPGGLGLSSPLVDAVRDLVRVLRLRVVPALLNSVEAATTATGTTRPILHGFNKGPKRDGSDKPTLHGFNKGGRKDFLGGFDVRPRLEGFNKGFKKQAQVAQSWEQAVGKSAKKAGKFWTELTYGPFRKFYTLHGRKFKATGKDAELWEKRVGRSATAVGKQLKGFQSKSLQPFAKDFRLRMTRDAPADAATFRSRTSKEFRTTSSNLRGTWSGGIKPMLREFGGYPKTEVAPLFSAGTKLIGDVWRKVVPRTGRPISATIAGPINEGLVGAFNKIAEFVGGDKFKKLDVPQFATGGYTGDGGKFEPKGVVHGGEFVINKASTSKLERKRPGLLASLNGYANGGKVGGDRKVVWPVPGRDVSTYGGHDGVDINRGAGSDDYGDPIVAAFKGRISYVGSGRGYGDPAIFQSGWPGEMVYGHASQALVKPGQQVDAGQLIGRVGSTGNSSAPHLHFGWPGGTYEAALAFLQGGTVPPGGYGNATAAPAWVTKIIEAPKKWAKGLLQSDALGKSGFGEQAQGFLNKLTAPIASWATDKLGPAAYSGPASGNVQRFVPIIQKVLGALGEKSGPTLMGAILARMQKESGGNVGIVNDWDSNAAAGHPSVGLMQVIGPTYQAHKPHPDKGPYKYGTSIDPYSNIYAGLHYARDRYGTIYNGMTQPGGYKNGGWLKPGEVGFNETSDPEMVFNLKQWGDIRNAARAEGAMSAVPTRIVGELDISPNGKATIQGWAASDRVQSARHTAAVGRMNRHG